MHSPRRIVALVGACLLVSSGIAGAQQPNSAQNLASARQSFATALAHAKANPGKASYGTLREALTAVRQASTARADALYAEIRTLGTGAASEARAKEISAELRGLGIGPNFGPIPVAIPEVEPNGTAATATFLDTASTTVVIATGSSGVAGDVDFFRFTAPANGRAWVFVNTPDDSTVDLLAGDGVSSLAFSDDDTFGTDYAGAQISPFASALFGEPLTAGGTYYLRVAPFGGGTLTTYDVLLVVEAGTAVNEAEPNDAPGNAQVLISPLDSAVITNAGSIGLVNAQLEAGGGDLDAYTVFAQPGNVLYFNLDADPTNSGTATVDPVVEVYDNVPSLIFATDFGGAGDGETSALALPAGGQYYVLVRGFTPADAGPYRLMVALANDHAQCVTQTLSWVGRLGAGSTFGVPGFFNFVNFNKIVRNGTPSTCLAPKPCPGLQDLDPTVAQFYPLRNATDQPQCVTVTVQLPAVGTCGALDGQMFVAAYGEQFNPFAILRPCLDYVADLGNSPVTTAPQSFSFTVPPRSWFWLVMYDVDSGPPVCDQFVQFTVAGLPTGCQSDVSITKTGPATAVLGPGPINYDVTVRVNGPMAAPAFQFADTVPPGFSLTAITPVPTALPAFSCYVAGVPVVFPVAAGSVVTCTAAGPFPVGSTFPVTFTYDTTAVVAGCVPNTATLQQPTSPPWPPPPLLDAFLYNDPNATNNSSTVTTCFGAAGNLGIVKLDNAVSGGGPDPVSAGRDLTYTIRVFNFGPLDAAGVSVTDDLSAVIRTTPPNAGTTVPLRFKAVRKPGAGGWTCATPYPGTIGTVTCQSALLPPGIYEIGLVVTVPPVCQTVPANFTIRNTAFLTGLTDTDPLDNVATQDTIVQPKPCFSFP